MDTTPRSKIALKFNALETALLHLRPYFVRIDLGYSSDGCTLIYTGVSESVVGDKPDSDVVLERLFSS